MMASKDGALYLTQIQELAEFMQVFSQMIPDLKKSGRLYFHMRECFESEKICRQLPAETTWYNKAMEHRKVVVEQVLAKNVSVSEFCKNELLKSSLAKMIETLTICERSLFKLLDRVKAVHREYQFMSAAQVVEILARKTA